MSNSKNSQTKLNRVPSRRDQEIFRRVVVHCELQYQVAKDLGLSPGRISQILARVRRWLACGTTGSGVARAPRGAWSSEGKNGGDTTDAELAFSALEHFSALEIQRLQRQLAQSRHEYLYEISIRGIKHMSENPKHTTVRTESKPTDDDSLTPDSRRLTPCKVVTTVRDQPLNVQLIKTAQRSAIELQKLAELDPLPPPEISHNEDRRAMAVDLVTDLLDDAAISGKVRSVGWDTERPFVEDLFQFLLGEPHRGLATNVIAADAKHGRLRPDDRAYPGHDPMRITPNSPPGDGAESAAADSSGESLQDAALKNTKPQSPIDKQESAHPPTASPSLTTGAGNACDDATDTRPVLAPSDFPLQNPKKFSTPPRSEQVVRLTCPIVVNPPWH
jgi:hypothetical protein